MAPDLLQVALMSGLSILAAYVALAILLRDRIGTWTHGSCTARREGQRQACGYSLDGLGAHGVCPECGSAFRRRWVRSRRVVWRWSRLRTASLVVGVSLAIGLLPSHPGIVPAMLGAQGELAQRGAAYLRSWPEPGVIVMVLCSSWLLAVALTRSAVRVWRPLLIVNAIGLAGDALMTQGLGDEIGGEYIRREMGLIAGWAVAVVLESVLAARAASAALPAPPEPRGESQPRVNPPTEDGR